MCMRAIMHSSNGQPPQASKQHASGPLRPCSPLPVRPRPPRAVLSGLHGGGENCKCSREPGWGVRVSSRGRREGRRGCAPSPRACQPAPAQATGGANGLWAVESSPASGSERERHAHDDDPQPTHASHRLTFAKRASGVGSLVRLFPQPVSPAQPTQSTQPGGWPSQNPPAGGLASRTHVPSHLLLVLRSGPSGFVVLRSRLLSCNVAPCRGWGGVTAFFPTTPLASPTTPPGRRAAIPDLANGEVCTHAHARPGETKHGQRQEGQEEEQESAVAGGARPCTDQTRNQTDTDHRPPTTGSSTLAGWSWVGRARIGGGESPGRPV